MFNLEKKSPGMKWGDMIDPINYLKFCHVEEALGLFLAAQPSGGSYWEPSCCSIAVNFLTRKLPEILISLLFPILESVQAETGSPPGRCA